MKGGLWKQVISGNYGVEEGEWHSCKVRDGYGVGYGKP